MLGKRLGYWKRKFLARVAAKQGYELVPKSEVYAPFSSQYLDADSKEYLRLDNKRLLDLVDAYKNMDSEVTVPVVWQEGIIDEEALRYFRGENAYVWQNRSGNSEHNYALTAYYIHANDSKELLRSLNEDDAFGVNSYEILGKKISRDLLDSIMEISFLDRYLSIFGQEDISFLDIGAGYGRLAYRMCKALPNLTGYYCVDAVPASTFLCEYYLKYRKVDQKAHVIPLNRLDMLNEKQIKIAINIHSFSECSPDAIKWWCEFIASQGIKYLMVVPNPGSHGGTKLATTPGEYDFSEIIENAGYRQIVKEPKFMDPSVQRNGIFSTYYYLFELI